MGYPDYTDIGWAATTTSNLWHVGTADNYAIRIDSTLLDTNVDAISIPKRKRRPPPAPGSAVAWLDKRVNEMRVRL